MRNKNSSSLMSYIIAFVIVFGGMAIFGGFNVPNAAGDNIKSTYSCDVKYVSLNTSINTVDKNGNPVNISGDILKFIEDPLSMRNEAGDVIAYAGDSYNLVSQDDHGIYLNGDFVFDVVGEFSFFGDKYYLRDSNGNTIATVDFNWSDTNGKMYDANGALIAQYVSAFAYKDYIVYVYDENTIDENALLMVFSSYVSDKEADS